MDAAYRKIGLVLCYCWFLSSIRLQYPRQETDARRLFQEDSEALQFEIKLQLVDVDICTTSYCF